jgi:hypothetical protein
LSILRGNVVRHPTSFLQLSRSTRSQCSQSASEDEQSVDSEGAVYIDVTMSLLRINHSTAGSSVRLSRPTSREDVATGSSLKPRGVVVWVITNHVLPPRVPPIILSDTTYEPIHSAARKRYLRAFANMIFPFCQVIDIRANRKAFYLHHSQDHEGDRRQGDDDMLLRSSISNWSSSCPYL